MAAAMLPVSPGPILAVFLCLVILSQNFVIESAITRGNDEFRFFKCLLSTFELTSKYDQLVRYDYNTGSLDLKELFPDTAFGVDTSRCTSTTVYPVVLSAIKDKIAGHRSFKQGELYDLKRHCQSVIEARSGDPNFSSINQGFKGHKSVIKSWQKIDAAIEKKILESSKKKTASSSTPAGSGTGSNRGWEKLSID